MNVKGKVPLPPLTIYLLVLSKNTAFLFSEKKMSDNLRVAVLSLIVGFILGKIAEKLTTAKDENDEDKEVF